jgi:acetyl esterase/lipase
MSTATLDTTTQFDVEDVEYLRHGDKPLLARVYKPRGEGLFPALVEVHGGAWCLSDRFTEKVRHEFMASHGVVSIALDFRSGNEDPYPASVADVNYAVRWAKQNAKALKTRPELIGLSGQSSGGHLAMLAAMKPNDPRYAAIKLAGGSHDASVRCVMMSWPVINPLGRYRFAKRELQKPNPPEWPKTIIPRQDSYWQSEANMEEGSPMLILERGEKVHTPPAFWLQGKGDVLHDYQDAESKSGKTEANRFVDNYRKAGGEITLEYFDMESAHTGHSPDLSKRKPDYEKMVRWLMERVR